MGGRTIVMKNSRIVLPQIWLYMANILSQMIHNAQMILFIVTSLPFPSHFWYFVQSKTIMVDWNKTILQPILGHFLNALYHSDAHIFDEADSP